MPNKPNPQNPVVFVRLPKEWKVELDRIAKAEFRTIASVIRQAINEYLLGHKPKK